MPLNVVVGDPVEGQPVLKLACVPVAWISGELTLDLRYEQRWYYRKTLIGALSAAVAVAPAETLAISVRNTQRKQFEQETVDEVERSQQIESTFADKDVLNVTRSASKSSNWTISGNASITLPKFSVGVGGSASGSVTQASSSSAQRSRESTQKSASNLKTLQKIQIREMAEITAEAATTRKLTNPYRDRSLRLDVYELAKEYCIELHLTDVAPVLVFELNELAFDRAFVLTNGAFLTDELVDRMLQLELGEAIQLTTDLRREGAEEKVRTTALLALEYLFAGPTIFNFPLYPTDEWPEFPAGISGGIDRPRPPRSVPDPWNENDPASSFLLPLFNPVSGMSDAIRNKAAVIFSILAFYYQLYTREVLPAGPDGRLAVELAMSLDQVLAPRWLAEETTEITQLIDQAEATEVFRRLGGFLTMTSGILRPLLGTAEEEREARQAAERAEFVVTRVIDHLRCHRRYYTQRYLQYIADKTHMRAVFQFVEELLSEHVPGMAPNVRDAFDPEATFLDQNRVVVPLRIEADREELDDLLKQLEDEVQKIEFGRLDSYELTIPTDGVHIEAVAGRCVLDDVSAEPLTGPIHVSIDKE